MSTLAERLQTALDRRNAKQADLAAHCGVKAPSVSNWFTGETKSLKADSLRKAAEFLRCSRDWLETGRGLPGWLDQAGAANAIEGEARVAGPLPQGEQGVTLEQALEALGIALAVDMPDEVREDVADALTKLARRKGQFRDQQQVLQLLTEPVAAAPTKRHGT